MLPVNKDELVEPRLNVPPGSSCCACASSTNRVSWNAMRGWSRVPSLFASASQKGVAPDDAIVEKPRPMSPDTGAVNRFEDIWVTTAESRVNERGDFLGLGDVPNVCARTSKPAIWTTSWPRVPRAAPDP